MPKKRKPFQQKRETPAPYRRGRQVSFYVSNELERAIGDVARARGNISRSQLVNDILAAHPDIAAQIELYRAMGGMWPDAGPGADIPDAGATRESDQEQDQLGLWEDMLGLGPDGERSRDSARKKRGKPGKRAPLQIEYDAGPDEHSPEGAATSKPGQDQTDQDGQSDQDQTNEQVLLAAVG